MIGTMVGHSRIVARRAIWQTNSEPMMDRAPIDVAFRHLPVRAQNGHTGAAAGPGRGKRSILPGWMTHAFEP
jgi:hypothetical protein